MIKIDTYSGKYLEKEGYAGIRIGDEVIGLNALKEGNDFILSLDFGLYLVAGGDVSLDINLSEVFRRMWK